MLINLNTLLDKEPNLSSYEIKPGDDKTPAPITVADLKEMLLAINACSRRISSLAGDLEKAEERIDSLGRGLRAISDYHY